MASEDEGPARTGGSGGAGERRRRAGAARRVVWCGAIGVLVAGVAAGGWSLRHRDDALRLRRPPPTAGTAPWSARAGAPAATLTAATGPAPALPPVADPSRPGSALASGGFDLGDPFVVDDGTGYALFTSQSIPALHVPVVSAAPKGSWGTEADALPTLPPWVAPGPVTGPDVTSLGGRWLLYFSAPSAAAGAPCIGVATAGSATGPYQALPAPLVCPPGPGGVTDPRAFIAADGTPYLLWTGAAAGGGPAVWAQQLAATGTALVGLPTASYRPDLPWQHGTVASASLMRGGGRTWLVYSAGGGFTSPADAIGVAWCDSPLGPCGDQGSGPLLASDAQGPGPGSPAVLAEGGQTWLVYNPAYSVGGATARSVDAALVGFGASGPYLATSGLPPAPPANQSTPADPAPAPVPALAGPAPGPGGPAPAPAAAGVVDGAGITAVEAAVSQLGAPYVWGGDAPGHGFDCSGLVQWAWGRAGVAIPRTAAAQYAGLPHVALSALQPGDLLFYYDLDGDHAVDHVVMYVGSGPYGDRTVVQAPAPGQAVSYAAAWSQGLVGAARP